MNVSGRLTITGSNGKTDKQQGRIKVTDIENAQFVEVEGNISFQALSAITVSLRGKVKGNDIAAQELMIDGSVKAHTIHCEKGKLRLSQTNNITQIIGKDVNISVAGSRNPELVSSFIGSFLGRTVPTPPKEHDKIYIGEINSDEVVLEKCTCDNVCCKSVVLQGGCKIKNLKYTDSIKMDSYSYVENLIHDKEES